MQLSDIKIRKTFNTGPLKAIVSVTFENCLAVHDIKIINTESKLFIIMPNKKLNDGTFKDIVHPINATFRAVLERAILDEYSKLDTSEQQENRDESASIQ